jgi:predicted nucleotidyltransferase
MLPIVRKILTELIDLDSVPLAEEAPANQRETLHRHLRIIVQECLAEFGTLEAIILYGGYGRGEGGWIEDREEWRPYNDYDIVVVVRQKLHASRVVKIRKKLAEMLGIRWVDLSQKTPTRLKWLRPSIYNYDLRNASSTIYGSRELSKAIPRFEASELPLDEVLTLFCTRLWPFMGALGENAWSQGVEGEDARFFRNQMAKATLAAVDVILLLHGEYHPSYRERVNRACAKSSVASDDCHLFRWALEEKLLPTSPIMSGREVTKLYDQVHRLFARIMYQGLSAHFGREIVNVYQLERAYRRNIKTLLMRIAFLFLKRNLKFERVILINIVQFYLFAAYEGDGEINSNLLRQANNFLSELDTSIHKSMSWYKACNTIAIMRNHL